MRDESGHLDVCNSCLGLGYLNETENLSEETRRNNNRFYLLMTLAAFILGLYYIGLYVALEYYGISLILTMVLFVGGHLIIFGGFFFYVLYRILRKGEENGNSNYR